jgi:hypothetical protein
MRAWQQPHNHLRIRAVSFKPSQSQSQLKSLCLHWKGGTELSQMSLSRQEVKLSMGWWEASGRGNASCGNFTFRYVLSYLNCLQY